MVKPKMLDLPNLARHSPGVLWALQAYADQLDNVYLVPTYFNGDDAMVSWSKTITTTWKRTTEWFT